MWGRVLEIVTATWLAASPWIYRAASDTTLVTADLLVALLICVLSGFAYWPKTRYAYLGNLAIGLGLIIWGRIGATPLPPEQQNHIVVGLFLMMMALIPNHASQPPRVWRASSSTAADPAAD